MDNQTFGKMGESIAAEILQKKGYQILQRNYRSKAGEIDLIAAKGITLHFIEVKARQSYRYGRPCEAVDAKKISHIRRTAALYLKDQQAKGYVPGKLSFDVMEITIEHLQNAF